MKLAMHRGVPCRTRIAPRRNEGPSKNLISGQGHFDGFHSVTRNARPSRHVKKELQMAQNNNPNQNKPDQNPSQKPGQQSQGQPGQQRPGQPGQQGGQPQGNPQQNR